ncbi:hypothetical protein SELMODRAFT_92536 [Selaginella moellendorffii]|uniref:Neprosin PEP catalytic domain-containing protein n=1 Tax=Selaginella moellendorffii TaxID=88036 RepID=D8RFD5_SELML|nr:hypothetical protein SELMODRAFT_114462 [Selaginella moellendorffii]EFJ29097.1 hypothetical protein SELMODRAFT_92536 [Selaginella moellendorffii]
MCFQHAVAFVRGKFRGFKTTINIWKPRVEQPREFSLSQFWLISSYDRHGVPRSTMEAGWQIYPSLYGGDDPRLFVYWTADGYNSTGCYNLGCDGFVQVSSSIVLGGAISSRTSTAGSTQSHKVVCVLQDPRSGNWWLRVSGSYVGYWKASALPDFANGASAVSCGGEVLEANRHTRTQMGSGAFPNAHYKYAAYHRDIQIVNANFRLQQAQNMARVAVKKPGCYDIGTIQDAGRNTSWGTYFFYGGPGYSSKCV